MNGPIRKISTLPAPPNGVPTPAKDTLSMLPAVAFEDPYHPANDDSATNLPPPSRVPNIGIYSFVSRSEPVREITGTYPIVDSYPAAEIADAAPPKSEQVIEIARLRSLLLRVRQARLEELPAIMEAIDAELGAAARKT